MEVLVKPKVEPTEQEMLYEALQCGEHSCGVYIQCNGRGWLNDEGSDEILF